MASRSAKTLRLVPIDVGGGSSFFDRTSPKTVMIRLAAHIHSEDGWGRQTRNFARALGSYEPTALEPLGRRDGWARSLFDRLRPSWKSSAGITLGLVEHTFAMGTRYKIPYYIGETTRIPLHRLHFLQRADMVWTASNWGRQVLEANGVAAEKIRVVPEGVDCTVFTPPHAGQRATDVFRFLSVGKWEVRKGGADLVRAYTQEFDRNEPVELVMHCGGPGVRMSDVESEIAAANRNGGPPVVLSEPIDLPGLVALMQRCNAFVLPTKGEGWGLPILEAMACELPCIVTDYSGLTEFANESNCFLIPVREMRPVHDPQFFNPRLKWGEWADPDPDDLRRLMRFVYENREVAAAKARRSREEAARLWSWDCAAQAAIAHLRELRGR